jgi:hydroxyacylglutathione hydrolase
MGFYDDGFHTVEKIAEDTYRINEKDLVNAYLLVGEKQALLIDSGDGLGEIRKVAESVTDKPIILALTHGHCDHAGGRNWFKSYYICEKDTAPIYKFLSSKLACNALLKGHPEWKLSKKPYHAKAIKIKDGYVFDLGGRQIKTINVPGHTKGSMIFLDDKEKLMVTGDDANISMWLQLPGCVTLTEWKPGAEKILSLIPSYTPWYGHGDGRQTAEQVTKTLSLADELLKTGQKDLKKKYKNKSFAYPDNQTFPNIVTNVKHVK